jgi:hypothetical protein
MPGEKSNVEKKKLIRELISHQLKNIPIDKRLQYRDLCRIAKYISSSIFDEEECCIWEGYITNAKNAKKGTYINFFFRNNKVALHRLFYINFVGHLNEYEYLKFTCVNKGKCCNINHLIKYRYNVDEIVNKKDKPEEIKKDITKEDLTIHFD